MNWKNITNDPLDHSTIISIQEHLRNVSYLYNGSLLKLFTKKSMNNVVMHVGCYEHAHKYTTSKDWKHQYISDASRFCLGIDIDQAGIDDMKNRGYEALCIDATSNVDIGKKFDLIIIGDVIEHLTSLDGVLKFAYRHLESEGSIIVSTPNPFYIGTVFRAWFRGPMVANLEHCCWISESNILELTRRLELKIDAIIYPTGNSSNNKLISFLKNLMFRFRSYWCFTTLVYEIKGR